LAELLKKDGYTSVQQVVGVDALPKKKWNSWF